MVRKLVRRRRGGVGGVVVGGGGLMAKVTGVVGLMEEVAFALSCDKAKAKI